MMGHKETTASPGDHSSEFQHFSRSATMRDMLWNAGQIARTDMPVLIAGETGTGKQWLARQIHRLSGRMKQPFVEFPCDVIRSHRLENELMGSRLRTGTAKRGALARTQHGTLLLHHVSELPRDVQSTLARILETRQFVARGTAEKRPFEGRIIATVIGNPHALFQEGRMEWTLYRFFGAIVLNIPPLRDRLEDLPGLVDQFILECNETHGTNVRGVDEMTINACLMYSWPANIRELRNAIRYATLLCAGETILEHHLPPYLREEIRDGKSNLTTSNRSSESEEHLLQRVICRTATIKEAAKHLGISLKSLTEKITRYGLQKQLLGPARNGGALNDR